MVLEDDIQFPEKGGYINWTVAVPRDAHIIALNTLVDFTRRRTPEDHRWYYYVLKNEPSMPVCSGVTTLVRYLVVGEARLNM
jgi:hypothetical protein